MPAKIDPSAFAELVRLRAAQFERSYEKNWEILNRAALARGEARPSATMSPNEWWAAFRVWVESIR